MPTVYRFEKCDGIGPYSEHIKWMDQINNHNIREDTPGLIDDNLELDYVKLTYDYECEDILFGFLSLNKLRDWFTCFERRRLRALGYNIRKYNAEVAIEGGTKTQCIFVKEGALPWSNTLR